MSSLASRPHNRIVMLCASINDVSAWPFWKFLQMKKVKGVTDLQMLAFNSEGGSFLGKIEGTEYSVKNFENVVGYHQPMLEEFLEKSYAPGRSYFVYGGHGMGDYLELEEFKTALQVHEMAKLFGSKTYEAILFDACFMSNLDCAYHLRHNTKWIGACEGYMWEEDVALDQHIFNTYTASAMSRFRDPRVILETIQRDYCNKTRLGDFSILSTEHVEPLWNYVEKHVWQRVYDGATFLNSQQREELQQAMDVRLNAIDEPNIDDIRGTTATSPVFQIGGSKKRKLLRATRFKHALYPSEFEDKHLVDLKQYLLDIACEEKGIPRVEPNRSSESEDNDSASGMMNGVPSSTIPLDVAEHEGLQLLANVVASHIPPQNDSVYCSPLGGLSLSVHEFSHMSKPLKRAAVDRTNFNERANEFLQQRSIQPQQRSKNDSQEDSIEGSGGTPQVGS